MESRLRQIGRASPLGVQLNVGSSGKMVKATNKSVDYDQDYYQWLMENAQFVREGNFDAVDLIHLAEELEDMGRSERRAIESLLKILIVHLLKWRYQPERRGASWELTITNARDAIQRRLADSPSLRAKLPELAAARYGNARRHAALETNLPILTFPETCPFSIDQMLDDDFWCES
jgi:hypothetical protein